MYTISTTGRDGSDVTGRASQAASVNRRTLVAVTGTTYVGRQTLPHRNSHVAKDPNGKEEAVPMPPPMVTTTGHSRQRCHQQLLTYPTHEGFWTYRRLYLRNGAR